MMGKSEDDDLAADLEMFAPVEKAKARSPKDERIIAGFEEIERYYEEHGRAPMLGAERDIFERLYAVRLDRLRALPECRSLLLSIDRFGLLNEPKTTEADEISLDDLASDLESFGDGNSLSDLKHVRSTVERKTSEEIANRETCEDFDKFEPLFKAVQNDLDSALRETRPFKDDARIEQGNWFILSGLKCYIADEGEEFLADYGKKDSRLRVIFGNGTESNLLKRSLERALQKDESGRRITEPHAGPLFSGHTEDGDFESGTVYVLQSKSDHPFVVQNREILHKIGITGGSVEKRVANASKDATYLLADVDVIAEYKLYNLNRNKFEKLLHRILKPAQAAIEIQDRFGNPVTPREWFLVPIFVIDEIIERFKDGSLTEYYYDPKNAKLRKR